MTHDVEKQEEKLPPGVVRIKPPPRFGMFGSMLIKLALGVALLGAGVLAVYYSINEHSDDKNNSDNPVVAKTYFTLNRTQHSIKGGVYTREIHLNNDGGVHHHQTNKTSTIWVQDHENQWLFHSIGTPNTSDWEVSYFVQTKDLVKVNSSGCFREPHGYESFIASFGLSNLVYLRSEEIQTSSHGGKEEFTPVNLFQGDPLDLGGYGGHAPFVGVGYMDADNSKTYAWQLYFPDNTTHGIYFAEYWYPKMVAGLDNFDPRPYIILPLQCSNLHAGSDFSS